MWSAHTRIGLTKAEIVRQMRALMAEAREQQFNLIAVIMKDLRRENFRQRRLRRMQQ